MKAPGFAFLAIARRVCSSRVVESLVVPALADLQHEYRNAAGRGRWRRVRVLARGYAGLVAALVMDLGAFPARHVRENWVGEAAPGRQLLGPVAARAGAVLVALTTIALIDGPSIVWRRFDDHSMLWEAAVTLLPSILAVTVPISLLLGLVMGLRRLSVGSGPARRWMAPASGLSLAVAAGIFVLCAWIVPVANHSYREIIFRVLAPSRDGVPLVKGYRELTFPQLTARISDARREGVVPALLVVEWHKKLVIPLFCAFLGPLAVGLASRRAGRLRTGASIGVAILVVTAFYCTARLGEQAAGNGRVSPVLGAWAAGTISPLAALFALARRRAGRPPSASPS